MNGGPLRRSDIDWIEVDGDVVAVTPAGGIHVLTGAAAALWQLLDGETLDGLDLLVAESFEIDAAQALVDIERSLAMLTAAGLVEPAGDSH